MRKKKKINQADAERPNPFCLNFFGTAVSPITIPCDASDWMRVFLRVLLYSFFFLPSPCFLWTSSSHSVLPAHQIPAPLLLVLPLPPFPSLRPQTSPPSSSLPFQFLQTRRSARRRHYSLSLTSCLRVLDSDSNGKKNPLPLALLLLFRHLNLWAAGWLSICSSVCGGVVLFV